VVPVTQKTGRWIVVGSWPGQKWEIISENKQKARGLGRVLVSMCESLNSIPSMTIIIIIIIIMVFVNAD
jgi:hypothetical protein